MKHFSTEEVKILRAVLNRLIPEDDYPSAWDAGVGDYMEKQFDTDLRHLVGFYQDGLAGLEDEALAEYGCGFADLTDTQQDSILQQLEANEVNGKWQVAPISFLSTLIRHTAEGYYSDEGQGGNRNAISWKMIGFENR